MIRRMMAAALLALLPGLAVAQGNLGQAYGAAPLNARGNLNVLNAASGPYPSRSIGVPPAGQPLDE